MAACIRRWAFALSDVSGSIGIFFVAQPVFDDVHPFASIILMNEDRNMLFDEATAGKKGDCELAFSEPLKDGDALS